VVVGSGGIKKFMGFSAGTDPGIESKTWGTLKSSGSESMEIHAKPSNYCMLS
jgi:hypothetical protein